MQSEIFSESKFMISEILHMPLSFSSKKKKKTYSAKFKMEKYLFQSHLSTYAAFSINKVSLKILEYKKH